MDLVSVVVTVQAGAQLVRCIESVLNQAYFEIELVLVDNGSTDGSATVCDEYAKKDSRVKVVHQERQELKAARTAGLKLAFGEYVMFLDSEDFLGVYAVERLLKDIKNSKAEVCICGIRYVDEKNEMLEWKAPRKSEIVEDSKVISHNFCTGNTCWRSEVNKLYWMGLFDDMVAPSGRGLEEDNILACIAGRVRRVALNHHRLYNYGVNEIRTIPSSGRRHKVPMIRQWPGMVRTALTQLCLMFLGWITIKILK